MQKWDPFPLKIHFHFDCKLVVTVTETVLARLESAFYLGIRDRLFDESTQWCVHQDRCVELSRGASNAHCCHLLESSQWVTPREELCHISLFQGAGDQHHHVVNHVAVTMATQRTEQMDVPLFVCLAFCIISHLLRTYFTTNMPSYSNNLIPCSLKAD